MGNYSCSIIDRFAKVRLCGVLLLLRAAGVSRWCVEGWAIANRRVGIAATAFILGFRRHRRATLRWWSFLRVLPFMLFVEWVDECCVWLLWWWLLFESTRRCLSAETVSSRNFWREFRLARIAHSARVKLVHTNLGGPWRSGGFIAVVRDFLLASKVAAKHGGKGWW